MITNERQYRITKAGAQKFFDALKNYDVEEDIKSGTPKLIAKAKSDQLRSEYDRLRGELAEYQDLRSGKIETFESVSLRDLPVLLVKARIARGWTQKELADALALKEQQVQRYESGLYSTAKLATLVKVTEALGLDIEELGTLIRTHEETGFSRRFPVNEMFHRGWFEHFSGNLSEAKNRAGELLGRFFLDAGVPMDAIAMHRKNVRIRGTFDEYALLAWHARVHTKAHRQYLPREFSFAQLNADWFRELAKLSIHSDGPVRARSWLIESGIHFIFEPHLSHTHLDGAALMHSDGAPIVALTVRHDRLDNFWFALFHELAHTKLHLSRPERFEFYDDTDAEADDTEREADNFALNALIPGEFWASSLARFSQHSQSVLQESNLLKIHPAIIAGRIRRESNNYFILNDLVGNGEVRQQFEESQLA